MSNDVAEALHRLWRHSIALRVYWRRDGASLADDIDLVIKRLKELEEKCGEPSVQAPN